MWQVIGQTMAVSLLKHSLEAETLAHAYLLVGPAHVGKMTLALNLAQSLNCEAAERPCLECASCRKIASGCHADVQIIGLAQNEDTAEAKLIGIDQIKQVLHSASLPPFEGLYKVFIIDGAELLSIDAANCLLKTLEEPVGRVTFILLTVNDNLLPATVVSRCQRLELTPLPIAEVASALVEKWGIEPERARLLAGLSHGCLGWALSASVDDSRLQQRNEELDRLLDIITADVEERFAYVARMAAHFNQNRRLVYNTLDLWIDYWRDLMLVKAGCKDFITNVDRLDRLVEMAKSFTLAQIKVFIDNILASAEKLRLNANPRLALEVLMLDIPEKEGGNGANLAAPFSVTYG